MNRDICSPATFTLQCLQNWPRNHKAIQQTSDMKLVDAIVKGAPKKIEQFAQDC